jgi:sodium transport system ATP-binding protein
VIQVVDFHKTYRDTVAVRGLSFQVPAGAILGLVGANGAGKTTTLRVLATLLAPTSGTARVDGIDVAVDPLEVRRRIGFLSGTTGLYPRLTPRETLTYFGKLHGIVGQDLEVRIEALLDRFGMREYAEARCESLSTGQRQKVSIAAALLHDPPLVLLDEPLGGLDPQSARALKDLLRERASRGLGVLVSTHLLDVAERLCDRVVVLHHGRKRAEGTLAELRGTRAGATLEDVFLALTRQAE